MKLVVRKADGTREMQDASDIAAPSLRTAQEVSRARGISWEATRGKDGLLRQRPVGTTEQLAAYAKANPFSWAMFQRAERVLVQEKPEVWEWLLPDGSVVEGLVNDAPDEEDARSR